MLLEWVTQKDEELRLKRQFERQKKEQELAELAQRRQDGEKCYEQWLEQSLVKMQEEQALKQEERRLRAELTAAKARTQEQKQAKAAECYNQWLAAKDAERRRLARAKQAERSNTGVSSTARKMSGREPVGEEDPNYREPSQRKQKHKKKGRKAKKKAPKQSQEQPFEENIEEHKGPDIVTVTEKMRPRSSAAEAKRHDIDPIAEEPHPGPQSKGEVDAEAQKKEQKMGTRTKAGLGKKKGKGGKHDPFADQIFEELSSIQRNSQHGIEGENSAESGILNIDRANPAQNKPNTSI